MVVVILMLLLMSGACVEILSLRMSLLETKAFLKTQIWLYTLIHKVLTYSDIHLKYDNIFLFLMGKLLQIIQIICHLPTLNLLFK